MWWRSIVMASLLGTAVASADIPPERRGCGCGATDAIGALLAVGLVVRMPRRRA